MRPSRPDRSSRRRSTCSASWSTSWSPPRWWACEAAVLSGSTRAVVLRATPYRDHDLVVDLLGEQTGRVAALARSARRSQRRFGGALEVGTRLT
ncbi:MAG: recombination protein O N-terminal domain-containing protein, partial [Myxococcales bacterium]|nr:recombination protein O N-terminal domain-containing protein [Myxococcales bacterium]